MRFNCDKNSAFVIKKHEDGKIYDILNVKVDHHGEIHFMTMQSSGNLVIYSTENEPMWYALPWG